MILEKLAELEKLIDVPNVDKHPQESMKAMQMLNLTVEIRGMVKALEKPLPTDEQIERYALENILDEDSLDGFLRLEYWESGAKWMRDLIRDKSSRIANDIDVTSKTYTAEETQDFAEWTAIMQWIYDPTDKCWFQKHSTETKTTKQLRELWEVEPGRKEATE